MQAKNVPLTGIIDALESIQGEYGRNLMFRYPPKAVGRQFQFTVTVKDSKGPGGRRGMRAACWHVHGDLFEAILARQPNAVIKTAGREVTVDGGNWVDWNVGSMMEPLMYSETCRCGEGG